MSSASDNASRGGNAQGMHQEPSCSEDMDGTPSTEALVSTPAMIRDVLSSSEPSGSAMTQDNKGCAVLSTPHNQYTHSKLLESTLHEVQTLVRALQQRNTIEMRRPDASEPGLTADIPATNIDDSREFEHQVNVFDPDEVDVGELQAWEGTRAELCDHLSSHKLSRSDNAEESLYTYRAMHLLGRSLLSLQLEEEKGRGIWDQPNHLRSMQNRWEVERMDLFNNSDTRDRRPSNTSAHSMLSSELATKEGVLAVGLEKAELNEVDWWTFTRSIQGGPQSYVIDVLTGDPIINWEQTDYSGLMTGKKTRPHKISVNAGSPPYLGRDPLPERIRINSTHILRILEVIHGGSLDRDTSLVMIRPYKTLTCYEHLIRSKFRELQIKFAPNDPIQGLTAADPSKETNASINARTEYTETTGAEEGIGIDGSSTEQSNKTVATGCGNTITETDDDDPWTSSPTAYQHLKCLIHFMDERLHTKIAYLRSDYCQAVSFPDVWYLFKPGDEVIEQNRRQVYRILNVSSAPHRRIPPRRVHLDKNTMKQEETPVVLVCVYIDFDGKELGPRLREFRIARYEGEKEVTALEVYPLYFADRDTANEQRTSFGTKASEKPTLREKMIARGKMFMNMTFFQHMYYSGHTLDTGNEVDSHVIVDFEEAFSHSPKKNIASLEQDASMRYHPSQDIPNHQWKPRLVNVIGQSFKQDFGEERCTAGCCSAVYGKILTDDNAEEKRNEDYMARLIPQDRQQGPPPTVCPRPLSGIKAQGNELPEEDLLIMSYRVFGFILRNRKWAQLDLDQFVLPEVAIPDDYTNDDSDEAHPEVQGFRRTAFEQLVLPHGHKDIVRSLVGQHFRDKYSAGDEMKRIQQGDIVKGKGKGLIILLHGAPGVGKTTTAEAVAEMFNKPLFQMTCGDLGTTAPEVENSLETQFALASRWDCVLLLDEADVFLASRTKEDFKRNGLVSVFLQVLEYYTGVLFLTTTRVGDFDEAFASRFHLSLYYPQPDLESTLKIFKLNLRMIANRLSQSGRRIEMDEDDILDYATTYWVNNREERWNGRQIRNICQTALALAEDRAQSGWYQQWLGSDIPGVVQLEVEDVEVVSRAHRDFIDYLNNIRGRDAERWAKGLKLRGGAGEQNKSEGVKKENWQHEAVPPTTTGQQQPDPVGTMPSATGIPPQASATIPQPLGTMRAYGQPPPSPSGGPPGVWVYSPWPYFPPPPGAYAPPPNTQGAPAQAEN